MVDSEAAVLRSYVNTAVRDGQPRDNVGSDRWYSEVLANALHQSYQEMDRLRAENRSLEKEKEVLKVEYERNYGLLEAAYEVKVKELEDEEEEKKGNRRRRRRKSGKRRGRRRKRRKGRKKR